MTIYLTFFYFQINFLVVCMLSYVGAIKNDPFKVKMLLKYLINFYRHENYTIVRYFNYNTQLKWEL